MFYFNIISIINNGMVIIDSIFIYNIINNTNSKQYETFLSKI